MEFSSRSSVLSHGENSQITFRIEIPFEIEEKEGWHIASCKKLDVFSQGKTEEKSVQNLVETLELFLTSCYDRGVLDNVLIDCGFKKVDQGPSEEISVGRSVTVSLPLLADNNSACHA